MMLIGANSYANPEQSCYSSLIGDYTRDIQMQGVDFRGHASQQAHIGFLHRGTPFKVFTNNLKDTVTKSPFFWSGTTAAFYINDKALFGKHVSNFFKKRIAPQLTVETMVDSTLERLLNQIDLITSDLIDFKENIRSLSEVNQRDYCERNDEAFYQRLLWLMGWNFESDQFFSYSNTFHYERLLRKISDYTETPEQGLLQAELECIANRADYLPESPFYGRFDRLYGKWKDYSKFRDRIRATIKNVELQCHYILPASEGPLNPSWRADPVWAERKRFFYTKEQMLLELNELKTQLDSLREWIQDL